MFTVACVILYQIGGAKWTDRVTEQVQNAWSKFLTALRDIRKHVLVKRPLLCRKWISQSTDAIVTLVVANTWHSASTQSQGGAVVPLQILWKSKKLSTHCCMPLFFRCSKGGGNVPSGTVFTTTGTHWQTSVLENESDMRWHIMTLNNRTAKYCSLVVNWPRVRETW